MAGTAGLASAAGTTTTATTPATTARHTTTTKATVGGTAKPAVVTTTTPGSAPSGAVKNAPPGNNGTIKIDQVPLDGGNDNDPHISCQFNLEFFGYDVGSQTASVVFTAQPPSGTSVVTPTKGSSVVTFTGSGPGNKFDTAEAYKLNTAGLTAQAQQGFHIKVTVDVTGAQGADEKHKVFWYQPCTVVPPTTTTTTTGTTTTTTTGTTTTTRPTTTTTTGGSTTTTGATSTTEPGTVVTSAPGPTTGSGSPPAVVSAASPSPGAVAGAVPLSPSGPLPSGAGTDLGAFTPASLSGPAVGPWVLLIAGGLLLFACGAVSVRRSRRAS
jgi:hypothetical protein